MDIKWRTIINSAIISRRERRQIDFKERFDPNSAFDWSSIIKDIVAMANSGGGAIIFGMSDDGRPSVFDRKIITRLDLATISDKIHSFTNEHFSDLEVTETTVRRKKFGLMIIPEASSPIVFTKNGTDGVIKGKQKPIFLKGTIYFRHGAKSEPADSSDIKRCIDKEVEKTRKNWLEGIRKISHIKVSEEVLINKKTSHLRTKPQKLSGLLKISEQGTPVRLSHAEFQSLMKEYPLTYRDVVDRCKKKKQISLSKLQPYIESCKHDQNLSINWREVAKNLRLPFNVPTKYTYKEKVIENFR